MWLADPSSFKEAEFQPAWTDPAIGVVCYALTVFLLKQIPGKPMQMQTLSIIHNIMLIALSLAMGIGAFMALKERYMLEGYDGLFCSQRTPGTTLDGKAGYWIKIYYLSKYYECVDTFILCLKKKATIPLHLFHHGVMMVGPWMWCRFGWVEGSLWCVFVNSWIHVLMYLYYLLASLGYKVWWRRYLTQAQIIQFVTGFIWINIYVHQAITRGCGDKFKFYAAMFSDIVNVIFVILFVLFFIKDGKKQPKKNTD